MAARPSLAETLAGEQMVGWHINLYVTAPSYCHTAGKQGLFDLDLYLLKRTAVSGVFGDPY